MCGDKAGFASRSTIERHAEKMADKTDREWRAYECPHCELWHLTTTNT